MTRIRKLNCFDVPKLKKLISYLGSAEEEKQFLNALLNEPFSIVHSVLPLKYRFLSESYILLDEKEILALTTVEPTVGNPYKMNITRLVFQNNLYEAGKQLIDFVISRFSAKGATSFSVSVDECHDELLKLFIDGCGFRQCASETLWKIENFEKPKEKIVGFRPFDNSDAKNVCKLYNGELETIYKPALERIKQEFKDPILGGHKQYYKNRYVLEEPIRNKIIGYLSITTSDNTNFIIDFLTNNGFEISYDEIIRYAISEIDRRRSVYYPFIKQKNYTKTTDQLGKYLHEKGYQPIQTQLILVKNFYRPIKSTENALQVFMFGENSKIITNSNFKMGE